jgi:hypothetical protein
MNKVLFHKPTDIEYTFVVKRSAEPKEVSNLWSLWVNGEQIVDNDTLSTVIAKMGFVFEQDGL